ncbi:alpha/beta-hydrolase, partial [Rhodotorula sp. JG-1b]
PPPPPVPVVLWHGLGDRFDGAGLQLVKQDLEARPELRHVFVHIVTLAQDGPADQRATFFGHANDQVSSVCAQLAALPRLVDPVENPSRQFDAIGFSQGGQFLRAVVERCNGPKLGGVTVRNLITLGSQHVASQSTLPPCPPNSSPFSFCRLMHLSLIREGVYSPWAQRNLIPAQYFRDPDRIDEYLDRNDFLRDINNERRGDRQPYGGGVEVGLTVEAEAGNSTGRRRNATYKENFKSLNRFVMFRFSNDLTVVPPHSAHFTLPASPNSTTCLPPCYPPPLPWSHLPLYQQDYLGLRHLHRSGGRVERGVCKGEHMQIGKGCWEAVVRHLGARG